MSDPDRPVVLTTVPSEMVASIVVAHLQEEGIHAEMSGALTSGFRAEAPGGVQILTRSEDVARAQELLGKWKQEN